MIGINIIKTNKPDIKSHQRGCYFKRKKNVIRKVLISNIIFYYINLCVKRQFATCFRCIVTVSFLIYLCILTSHTIFIQSDARVQWSKEYCFIFNLYFFDHCIVLCFFCRQLHTLVLRFTASAYSLWNRQFFLIYGENENKLEILNSFTHIALVLISACMTIDYCYLQTPTHSDISVFSRSYGS